MADYSKQAKSTSCTNCLAVGTEFNYEKPQHLVYLDAPWMDKFNGVPDSWR